MWQGILWEDVTNEVCFVYVVFLPSSVRSFTTAETQSKATVLLQIGLFLGVVYTLYRPDDALTDFAL